MGSVLRKREFDPYLINEYYLQKNLTFSILIKIICYFIIHQYIFNKNITGISSYFLGTHIRGGPGFPTV
jgi:hypothetical protein